MAEPFDPGGPEPNHLSGNARCDRATDGISKPRALDAMFSFADRPARSPRVEPGRRRWSGTHDVANAPLRDAKPVHIGPSADAPLVVDLDGTLLCSDLLLETGLVSLRAHTSRLPDLLRWLSKGKATPEDGLARATEIDVSSLPYDRTVIEFIKRERRRGRKVVLVTASQQALAERVAEHLQVFDLVIASDGRRSLSARNRRGVLVEIFGERGFDYLGNSRDDLPTWRSSRRAYVVNSTPFVERRARGLGNVEAILRSSKPTLRDWAAALRLHQWLKNLLIFVPLLAAHRFTELQLVVQGLIAFVCFGLTASGTYVLNDLLDLSDDRRHLTKRVRPFAAGRVAIKTGLIMVPLLLGAAFGGALRLLPIEFALVLAVYSAGSIAYSLALKRQPVIDVITLAGLYTLRIIAGAVALGLTLSFWIMAFSMFMFLSLALVKRYAELLQALVQGSESIVGGRGYYPGDRDMIASLGTAAGYVAVMVLALYINDSRAAMFYRHPQIIWFACPLLLLWISRVWLIAHRGHMNEDPVIFAVRDLGSLAIGALFVLIFVAAT